MRSMQMSKTKPLGLDPPVYPPIGEDKARTWLQDHYPVWHVRLDGILTIANPMALWLWGLIRLSDNTLHIQALFNINVFDLFRYNFSRIPVSENYDFFTKKSAFIKRLLHKGEK